jgi:hypothetical protein
MVTTAADAQDATDFRWSTNNDETIITQWSNGQFQTNVAIPGTIIIRDWTGPLLGDVTIPATITGRPVTWIFHCWNPLLTNLTIPDGVLGIAQNAFGPDNIRLESLTIAGSVTNIGTMAFAQCGTATGNHLGIYFTGNAPTIDPTTFLHDSTATVYYLPGTTGWGTNFGGLPTALWMPQAQAIAASSGGTTNPFGLNVTWARGKSVVVEASPNLINPAWTPVTTNTLTGGSAFFTDPQSTNYPSRFYRVRSQ